jgi:hypothetical protein
MKTVVDFIKTKVEENSDTSFLNIDWDKFDEIINQAKEMFEQQIIDAWIDAEYCNTIGNEINHEDGEQYYNETFKKQEQ